MSHSKMAQFNCECIAHFSLITGVMYNKIEKISGS